MFKIAVCQLKGSRDRDTEKNKSQRRDEAEQFVKEAASNGAKIVVLPEMWLCPFSGHRFRAFSETDDGESVKFMSALAKDCGIYLVGGSIPEYSVQTDKIYNTNYTFAPSGELIAKHRKVHLFDIDIKESRLPDGSVKKATCYKESDDFAAGDKITMCDMETDGEKFKAGIAICFDVRFPEMFTKMTELGAKIIFLPASFSQTTGASHWDLTLRARAVENQVYFIGSAPAFDPESSYRAYANSCVVGPWGEVAAHAGTEPEILYADIDFAHVDEIREQLPLIAARKPEVYR